MFNLLGDFYVSSSTSIDLRRITFMKLYYSPGACSLAVRITLHEIGIPCEFEAVNLQNKITASEKDYFKINPKGAVPALQLDNQQVLTENAVIQQYLADTHKAHSLLPSIENFERYLVLEWLNYISTDLHKGCGPLFNSALPEEIKASFFRPLLKNKLKFVDAHLEKNKFLFKDQFTIADSYLFVVLRWMNHLKVDISDLKNLLRYFNELKERAAVQKALKEENLN